MRRYEPNTPECIWPATEYLVASLSVDELGEGLGRTDLLQPLGDGPGQLGEAGVGRARARGGGGPGGGGGGPAPPPPPPAPATRPRPAPRDAGWPGPSGR